MTQASAPAKLILCGEHAVVYGRPAIALPLGDVRAYAEVAPGPPGSGLRFHAPDLGEGWAAAERPEDPLSRLAGLALAELGLATPPDLLIGLRSDIPIAGGMGSGAAIGTALVRALAAYAGRSLEPARISGLVFESERGYHGTPSGIDNTVVAYELPIWFERRAADGGPWDPGAGSPPVPHIEPLEVGAPLELLVGDTGVRSATRLPVGAVREAWQRERAAHEAIFDAVGDLLASARAALAAGDAAELGRLLDANQALLERLGVSSPELRQLIAAARAAGALGAKLSGAGWGGVMLALVSEDRREAVAAALRDAGAVRVLAARVAASRQEGSTGPCQ